MTKTLPKNPDFVLYKTNEHGEYYYNAKTNRTQFNPAKPEVIGRFINEAGELEEITTGWGWEGTPDE